MDVTEDLVGVDVPVPPIPPSLSDPGVVTIDNNMAMH